MTENIRAEADKDGAELIVRDPQMDAAEQATGVEEMVTYLVLM
ncbi:MAG: hypothetical protein U5N58_08495 [Actinomycetota bacterium]|nr:hypothetical protein [Actinomycetota bacterium]